MGDIETVDRVTELESPVDSDLRQWLELMLTKWTPELTDNEKPWGKINDCIGNYRAHPEYQAIYNRFFIATMLLHQTKAGEKVRVAYILSELRRIFGTVEMEIFDDAINEFHMHLTRQSPLN